MALLDGTRDTAARTAVRLEYATIGWNIIEALVALASGLAAASVALVAFGLDSAIEVVSAVVVLQFLRRLLAGQELDAASGRRSLRIIAVTFFALAAYVTVDAVWTLAARDRPDTSTWGLVITTASVILMPCLAWGKRHAATALDHHGHRAAAVLLNADAAETLMCAALSLAALVGLAANAILGWWWADPVAGLVVAVIALFEGREAWRGELLEDG